MNDLRTAAQAALTAMHSFESGTNGLYEGEFAQEIAALKAALAEPDLSRCPSCGGPADNGHDRCIPPNPYHCTRCMAEPATLDAAMTVPLSLAQAYENGWNAALAQRTLTDEVIAELWHKNGTYHHHFARAVERWLKGAG